MRSQLTNRDVADTLDRVGDLLQRKRAPSYRVRAYWEAARVLRAMPEDVSDLLRAAGRKGLEDLPGIGKTLASIIEELVRTGRLGLHERLMGQVSPVDLFTTVPGIGTQLARRISEKLGIATLEDLEAAAHDGRLAGLTGFGPRRVRLVKEALEGILRRGTGRRARAFHEREPGVLRAPAGSLDAAIPSIETVLRIDARYRRAAEVVGAPVPILRAEVDGWGVSASYSTSPQAQNLGRTRDWVVMQFERGLHASRCTVVTEQRGPLASRRVVRGRESECLEHYARLDRGLGSAAPPRRSGPRRAAGEAA